MSISGLNNNYYNAYKAYGFNSQEKTVGGIVNNTSAVKTEEVQKSSQTQAPKECQTCKKRKYQDQSDDSSVSFQTPQSVPSSMAFGAVSAHEGEHVRNEQIRAKQEGRKVVFQTVSIHMDICPECGKMYVSGGTTRTVTKADDSNSEENKKTNVSDLLPGMLFDKAG